MAAILAAVVVVGLTPGLGPGGCVLASGPPGDADPGALAGATSGPLIPLDDPALPQRGFFLGTLPLPSSSQSLEQAHQQVAEYAEFVPIWGRPTPFYDLAADLGGTWGQVYLTTQARENGLFPLVHMSFIGEGMTLATPPDLAEATLSDQEWRDAYRQAALDVVAACQPRYLSLGNEVNLWYETYGAEPGDPNGFQNYVSLYEETYDAVKALSPETQVFCTFAREMVGENREADLEALSLFDPTKMDLLVLTSYPFVLSGVSLPSDLPDDYYSRVEDALPVEPVGFSELGWPAMDAFGGEKGQADFLRDVTGRLTVEQSLDLRLVGWIYLADLDGALPVGLLTTDGTEREAYRVWQEVSGRG